MTNILKNYNLDPACPVRNVLDRFGDKWSILIIMILGQAGKMRFNGLHKTIGDISQKMLTTTLRTLEADGLITRKVFPETMSASPQTTTPTPAEFHEEETVLSVNELPSVWR